MNLAAWFRLTPTVVPAVGSVTRDEVFVFIYSSTTNENVATAARPTTMSNPASSAYH